MEGKLDMLIEPIIQEHQADQLAALSEQGITEYQHWLREAISQLQGAKARGVMLKSRWSMLPAEWAYFYSRLW